MKNELTALEFMQAEADKEHALRASGNHWVVVRAHELKDKDAEIAALSQDAERYRYLRSIGGQTWTITFTDGTTKRRAVGEYYDSVVDGAMAQGVQPSNN